MSNGLGLTISQTGVEAIKAALGYRAKQYKREIATAINQTSKQARILSARELKKGLPTVSVRALKSTIYAKTKADPDSLQCTLRLYRGKAISVKYLKPVQYGGGVGFQLGPGVKGERFIEDGFFVRRFGNHVFRRKGPKRGPLKKQVGPSTAEAFKNLDIEGKIIAMAKEDLPKRITERIRFLNLKAAGGLRGKQK